MKTTTSRFLWGAAAGLCLVTGMAWGACLGDEAVAAEWIFEPVEDSPGWVLNGGTDGDAGNLGLTGGAEFSTNVPPMNCDCGHSLFLPGTNGVAGAVSINHYDPLAWEEKFSILAWVRRGGEAGENLSARIFSDADSTSLTNTTSGVEFRFSGNSGTLALRINGVEVGTTVGGIAPTNGEWHHVAVVYDGTRPATNYATRNVHFYEDGVQRGVGSILQDAAPAFNGVPVVLGNASSSRTAANLLAGNIDDVLLIPGWAPDPVGNGNTNEFIRCFMEGNDDIFPPILVVPASVAAEAGECLEPVSVALGSVVAQDECGSVLVTNDAPALFEVGTTRVTWSAWDPAGNETTALQTVTVYPSLSGDCDGDGLTDYEEEMELGTDSTLWDTDGDGWGDDEELEMGFDPMRPNDYPRVTIHAIHYNPSGTDTGKEWVELYSASSRDVDLGGMQLQVGRPTGWSTVLAFPTNTILSPGHFLLIGESLVTNADLTATLDIPNAWTNEPATGIRLVRGGGTRNIPALRPPVDTVFIGGGTPFNSAGLDTAGWNSNASAWAHAGCILQRVLAGADNDRPGDWCEFVYRDGHTLALDYDGDEDGISDGDEWMGYASLGFGPTNPWNPDTDGDGLSDYDECHVYLTNPNRWATDGDIWPWMPPGTLAVDWPGSDAHELANGKDPRVDDENHNGFPDSWETVLGLDALLNGADSDGDGIDDISEILQNSDPRDSDDSDPHPYVIRYESSLPGWINGEPDNDVGFGGFVRVCFAGVSNPLGACVAVEEGNVSEDYTLTWDCAEFATEFTGDDKPGVRYSSAILSPGASLLVLDSASCLEFTNTPGGEYSIADFHASLVPDWNRDRIIDISDSATTWHGNSPFRFWVNDDEDNRATSKGDSDVPSPGGWLGTPNCQDGCVNGECDLLDFFPVWIDAGNLLANLPEGFECKLLQGGSALNAVYTDLSKASAGSFLVSPTDTGFGPEFHSPPQSASVFRVDGGGVRLVDDFVAKIKAGDGVLMCEGRDTSVAPLVFEVWLDGKRIFSSRLSLSVACVETMFRWVNLRGIAGGDVKRATDIHVPSKLPDTECNNRHFVFVHGYSVHETAARAWASEMFKRLFQSGSRAMFTAVTWHGNDSQIRWWIPFLKGKTPNYYKNVEHAFETAPHLATVVSNLPGDIVIAAHSLGNMLVSSAIKDCNLNVDTYFMIDAAVPMEAYDPSVDHSDVMRPSSWANYTNRNLWASKWFSLFPTNDARNELTWQGRFGPITNAYNYFSSEEDVLDNSDGEVPWPGTHRAWVWQEMSKGFAMSPGNTEGGWGRNPAYTNYSVATANALTPDFLREHSFFFPFDESGLYGTNGSFHAQQLRPQLLADAIPALSNPAGRNMLATNIVCDSIDMVQCKPGTNRGGWLSGDDSGEWHHSTIVERSYLFTHQVFESMVENGRLK